MAQEDDRMRVRPLCMLTALALGAGLATLPVPVSGSLAPSTASAQVPVPPVPTLPVPAPTLPLPSPSTTSAPPAPLPPLPTVRPKPPALPKPSPGVPAPDLPPGGGGPTPARPGQPRRPGTPGAPAPRPGSPPGLQMPIPRPVFASVEVDPEDSPAVQAAARQLRVIDTQLGQLAALRARLLGVQAAGRRAATLLPAASAAARARRAAADELLRRADATERSVVGLARVAYERGSLSTVQDALRAGTPGDFVVRLGYSPAVARAARNAAADARRLRAQVPAAEERVRQADALVASLTAQVVAGRSAGMQAATLAVWVQRVVPVLARQRTAVVAAARRAAPEDRARYLIRQADSGSLGQRIRGLAEALDRSGRAVDGTGVFSRPGTGPMTSRFGLRRHPVLGYVRMHAGVDFGRGDGTIYTPDDGVVLLTVPTRGYGNVTVVDHGRIGGRLVETLYAHQARFLVRPGQRVTKGQPIGVIGSTGMSTGPHLHFEVRIAGAPVDPAAWL